MNLHILPDSKFSEAFYLNVKECGLLDKNKFVVRSNQKALKYIQQAIPFAPLYSRDFSRHVGNTFGYDKVFIHQLSPLMYRWIAKRKFKELNWMSWGTDLYTLPFIKANFYEPETLPLIKGKVSLSNFLYLLKVYVTNIAFRRSAYSSVNNMLTWMRTEFDFARAHISGFNASHQDFFYENQMPYSKIDSILSTETYEPRKTLKLIIGNSGTPTNNHIDAIRTINIAGIAADLYIPVSYGDPAYISSLKKSVGFYKGGTIQFIDTLMDFEKYVRFLNSADALVMNHIRPQGYGNIFMMMYMNKPVILNSKNISLPDLHRAGIQWYPLESIEKLNLKNVVPNKEKIIELLSHDRLLRLYHKLFA